MDSISCQFYSILRKKIISRNKINKYRYILLITFSLISIPLSNISDIAFIDMGGAFLKGHIRFLSRLRLFGSILKISGLLRLTFGTFI
jgi:hypothetical protein